MNQSTRIAALEADVTALNAKLDLLFQVMRRTCELAGLAVPDEAAAAGEIEVKAGT
jgi:hypothetical protein